MFPHDTEETEKERAADLAEQEAAKQDQDFAVDAKSAALLFRGLAKHCLD